MPLVYCVLAASSESPTRSLQGVGGAPVRLVTATGLAAAVSETRGAGLDGRPRELLTFHRVIETLHRSRTVVPVRYGSVLEDEGAVARHLEERRGRYGSLLAELEGFAEMCVRILVPKDDGPGVAGEPEEPVEPVAAPPGGAYLRRRRRLYDRRDAAARRDARLADRLLEAFAGQWSKAKTERGGPLTGGTAAVHFLVRRSAVEPFRKRFRALGAAAGSRVLLSGPWPPYTFVGEG